MQKLPDFISDRLVDFLIESRSLAYLLVKKDGYLSNWGGKLSVYGVKKLDKSKPAQKQICFLTGLLPLDEESLYIPCLTTPHGICADLHLFPSEIGDWVLLMDATEHHMDMTIVQQRVNEYALLHKDNCKIN